jgi:catechol 2,3-dioxygenase-like lactoylglutathione lyase family enzyme
MRLSHVNLTLPRGSEDAARRFYGELLGLDEIPKPEPLRARGGVWFDAGGLDLHLSAVDQHGGLRPQHEPDAQRHVGLESDDVAGLRARLEAAGVEIDPGRPAPWERFFVRDPFGNRLEIHAAGGLRS